MITDLLPCKECGAADYIVYQVRSGVRENLFSLECHVCHSHLIPCVVSGFTDNESKYEKFASVWNAANKV